MARSNSKMYLSTEKNIHIYQHTGRPPPRAQTGLNVPKHREEHTYISESAHWPPAAARSNSELTLTSYREECTCISAYREHYIYTSAEGERIVYNKRVGSASRAAAGGLGALSVARSNNKMYLQGFRVRVNPYTDKKIHIYPHTENNMYIHP